MFYRADPAGVKSTGGAVGKAEQPLALPAAGIFNFLSANPPLLQQSQAVAVALAGV